MTNRLIAVFALLLFAGPALADPVPPPKVAVVDIDQLSAQSKATQSLSQQVETEIATFRNQMAFKYEALQEEVRRLRVESTALTEQQRVERQQALEERVSTIQAEETAGIEAIEARGNQAFLGLQDGFRETVALVAESLEVDLILQKPAYEALVAEDLVAAGAEDVTSLVLVLLDNKYPTATLPPAETGR